MWKSVWPIARELEVSFSLTGVLSAGVILFSQLGGNEQKAAIAKAKGSKAMTPTRLKAAFAGLTPAEQHEVLAMLEAPPPPNESAAAPIKQYYWSHLSLSADAIKRATVHFELLSEDAQAGIRSLLDALKPLPTKKAKKKPHRA